LIALTCVFLMFLLMAVGAPIGFTLILTGALGLFWVGGWNVMTSVLASEARSVASTFEFLTIPMFLLMAEFVLRSGIANDLFKAAAAWFGRVRGGLGIATALAGAGFGAICGSSTASAATLASTSLPAMMAHGYKREMAAGVVAISGTLAMLIPPSIAMVIYALLADVSVAKMLIAGVIPGLLITLTIALTVYFLAWRDPTCAPLSEKATMREKIALLSGVGPMLLLFGAVTGVIYTGIATPTEASAIGAATAGIIYLLRAKRTPAEVYEVFSRATRTSCMLGITLVGAHVFTTFFAYTQVTQNIVAWVVALNFETWVIILWLVAMYIVLGCFMDQAAILVLTIPIVAPILKDLHVDLVWFGVIMIVTAELGMVTPPLGLNCSVVAKYSRAPVSDVFRGVVPHVAAHVIAIGILLLFPVITLYLPNQMK
jgi:C4-dicarboxylate transporter DctM subunit